ncbi:MAG: alpha-N-arabinofuranosidase [Halobacteriaceae archaeon]
MVTDTVHVHAADRIDRVAPELFGHFAEHLGRCIYDGVWVGEDANVAHDAGLRAETVSLLAELDPPVLRWPGGCFADNYHWEDGVGPRAERPTRRNLFWTQGPENEPIESNEFGTDEFLRFCEAVGAEPYLAANVGSGTPEDAARWMEYCNVESGPEHAELRREHGREEPWGVRWWGVGNEAWGCGGNYDAASYAQAFARYATFLSAFGRVVEPGRPVDLVGVGHYYPEWNREFLEVLDDRGVTGFLDHLSFHWYHQVGDAVEFSDEEYYRLFADADRIGDAIDEVAATIDLVTDATPGEDVGVIVDEWGAWHPEANGDDGLEQRNTVRDALTAAGVLDRFVERADVVTMANIAQTVNVLQCVVETDAERAWPTPTYRVFDLYRPHAGATALAATVETDARELDDDTDVPCVSASVSRGDDGGVYATVANRDLDGPRTVRVAGLDGVEAAFAEVLFDGQGAREHSRAANADAFAADDLAVDVERDGVVLELPASSVAGVTVA